MTEVVASHSFVLSFYVSICNELDQTLKITAFIFIFMIAEIMHLVCLGDMPIHVYI